MMDFDYNKLNNLRIHELRDFARNVGVKSPTSLKKEEIIEQVLLILSGEHEPYVNTTKQGRPAKSLHHIDELVDFFVPKFNQMEEGVNTNYDLQLDDFDLLANAPSVEYNKTQESEKMCGYLDVHKNGYGIVRSRCAMFSEEDVFLHLYSIKTNNLHTGDFLEGEVKLIQEGRPRVMVNILSVNGKPLSELKNRVLFSNIPYHALNQPFQLNESETSDLLKPFHILEGSRNMLFCNGGFKTKQLVSLINSFSSNYLVLALNIGAMPEDAGFEKDNVKFANLSFNTEDGLVVSCANLMTEHAKRQLEQGKKVVVVINQLSKVLKAMNNLESGNYFNDLKAGAVNQIKNLVMCAKNVNAQSNLTLFILENNQQEPNMLNFLKYDLANVFNNVITL